MSELEELYQDIIEFNDNYFPGWEQIDELYYSNALAGEVGEICNDVKHRAGGGTNKKTVSTEKLLEECADVFIYLSLLIERVDNLESFKKALNKKLITNTVRMENHGYKMDS